MYKPFTKKLLASCALLLATIVPPSIAAKLDLEQEIVISAARQAGDLKNKIASYLDNVVITQGTLSITAELVQVHGAQDSEARVYIAKGEPAVFEQQLEDGSKIRLQANEIKYEPQIFTITITGNALLSQAGSEVRGEKIVYNTLTEQLEAEGDTNAGVTTILKPKAKDEK
jgi:lipopolysaccharide export system protein LptA